MDMSKLPRMSQTPAPAPPPAEDVTPGEEGRATHGVAATGKHGYREERGYGDEPRASVAEAWISIAIGTILLFASPYIWQWLLSKVSGYKAPFLPITDTGTGAEIPYSQSVFFFGHLCLFSFALVLVIDGLILFTRRVGLMMLALGFTVIASAMNFIHVARETMNGQGLPLMSAMAFAFGVYIAMFQWKLLQSLRMSQQRQRLAAR